MAASRAAQDGFTLLEVLVALAILAVGFGAAFQALSDDMHRLRVTPGDLAGTALAEQLLARVGHDIRLQSGEQHGQDPSGMTWSIAATPYGQRPGALPGVLTAYRIAVDVTWNDGRRERQVHLISVRLGREAG